MTVVLDCNIWITLSLNKALTFISVLDHQGVTMAGCQQLKKEIHDVILRPKFTKFFSEAYITKILALYDKATLNFKTETGELVVTDLKDNYLFALCIASKADYLVTGDKLLLAVGQYKDTKVISLSELKKLTV